MASELEAARALGADVRVDRAWVNLALDHEIPFGPWWSMIQELRVLPGYAGTLGKATGNALVGSLIYRRDPGIRRWNVWTGKRWREVQEEIPAPRGRGQPRYPALFEAVTAACRGRLLTEVLA